MTKPVRERAIFHMGDVGIQHVWHLPPYQMHRMQDAMAKFMRIGVSDEPGREKQVQAIAHERGVRNILWKLARIERKKARRTR